jgi:hypothetical protein
LADWTIKKGDTWPPLPFTLTDGSGPVDLSTATAVKLIAKSQQFVITGACVKDADQVANKGEGTYTWVAGDTANPGIYDVEFEVTWGTGKIETFPNSGYKSLEITTDLG